MNGPGNERADYSNDEIATISFSVAKKASIDASSILLLLMFFIQIFFILFDGCIGST